MNINYKGREIEIKYSFRSLMVYENITQQSFNPKNLSDIINFFYATVLAKTLNDNPVKYEEFIDWLDEDPIRLNDFCLWLTETIETNEDTAPKANKITKKKESKKDEKN